jgi:mono/diheme cytochrome c family protein
MAYHRTQMLSRSLQSISPALVAILLLSALTGCKSLPPSKPEAQFTAEEARGAQVYRAYCARCHYATTTRGRNGPGLQALTKIKSLPSGAPPTDERIIQTILHGHGMMPAQPVDEADLQSLLAYLHTL